MPLESSRLVWSKSKTYLARFLFEFLPHLRLQFADEGDFEIPENSHRTLRPGPFDGKTGHTPTPPCKSVKPVECSRTIPALLLYLHPQKQHVVPDLPAPGQIGNDRSEH